MGNIVNWKLLIIIREESDNYIDIIFIIDALNIIIYHKDILFIIIHIMFSLKIITLAT